MSKHTPGPWVTGNGNCHWVYTAKQNGSQRVIATCPDQEGPLDYDSSETAANARLIASAPMMFLALKELVAEHEMRNRRFCEENGLLQDGIEPIPATGGIELARAVLEAAEELAEDRDEDAARQEPELCRQGNTRN